MAADADTSKDVDTSSDEKGDVDDYNVDEQNDISDHENDGGIGKIAEGIEEPQKKYYVAVRIIEKENRFSKPMIVTIVRKDVESPERRYPCPSSKYYRYSDALAKLADESDSENEEAEKQKESDETPIKSKKSRSRQVRPNFADASDSEDETSRKRNLDDSFDHKAYTDDESDIGNKKRLKNDSKKSVKNIPARKAKKTRGKKKEKTPDKLSQLEIIKRKAQKIIDDRSLVDRQKIILSTALQSYELPSYSPVQNDDQVQDIDLLNITENIKDFKTKVQALEKEVKFKDEEIDNLQIALVKSRSEQCVANTEVLESEKRDLQEQINYLQTSRGYDKLLETPVSGRVARRKLFSPSPKLSYNKKKIDSIGYVAPREKAPNNYPATSSPFLKPGEMMPEFTDETVEPTYINNNYSPKQTLPMADGTPTNKISTPNDQESYSKHMMYGSHKGVKRTDKHTKKKISPNKETESLRHTKQSITS
ncbi:protein IWS1 homolog A-like [Copidosoma floridanum]|uniref:protein IWS1 homolog A-like n=1 Tax=Copidosoma floridanum TaxID=29053 RepID=UPI000C6F9ED7|nr:protein IWS1 homolog A-like [Copidosoma floridanum]